MKSYPRLRALLIRSSFFLSCVTWYTVRNTVTEQVVSKCDHSTSDQCPSSSWLDKIYSRARWIDSSIVGLFRIRFPRQSFKPTKVVIHMDVLSACDILDHPPSEFCTFVHSAKSSAYSDVLPICKIHRRTCSKVSISCSPRKRLHWSASDSK